MERRGITTRILYRDCLTHCLDTAAPLPQWYLLTDGERIAGYAGLITNDFNSRMDLCPWLAALFVEPAYREHNYGKRLIEAAGQDAKQAGFAKLYLCTDHTSYYERLGFSCIGNCYDPFGGSSRVYEIAL